MLNIGVTGGVGSGKTTASNLFQQLGALVIDSDQLAFQALLPNTHLYNAIVARYGQTIVTADQTLDRRQLRQIVFNDKQEKQWLEQLIHPVVNNMRHALLAASQAQYSLSVIPLLVEVNLMHEFDRILVIDLSPALQQQRAAQRDQVSHAAIASIIKAQTTSLHRLLVAHDVIFNDREPAHLIEQVHCYHAYYCALAKASMSG